ncbi:anti-sigma factor [Blastococcus tunisiensis]|uniref:Regulator of SigK n=1 Tax=Blastococcus tunisiensis TaxID=1798228 RepID=A0A1I2HHJ3_9ACTN|nr:anti-sigma factor [Blastococcus sp. DSM 46838]SFF28998.1 Anti-sigma-K factor rskA [Blastococcus sp. DSM 46838]
MNADHARFDELAVGWTLHALEPEDEAQFSRHLAGCARCAETVAETTDVMGSLAAGLPAAEPSDALGERLRAAVASTEQVGPVAVPGPSTAPAVPVPPVPPAAPAPRSRALPLALVAAAVAAVLGLGIWNVGLRSEQAELSATLAEQRDVVDALLTPGRATVATLDDEGGPVATVVAREDRVQVVTYGLPANDAADTTYVLWGLGADAPTPLGPFDVEGSQIAVETVGSEGTGLDGFAQYGISIEPGREAPSEPTEVVATGQVTS